MTAEQREFVVNYGKLHEETPELIDALIEAAVGYLDGSGIAPELAQPAVYNVALAGIVAHYHENRAAVEQSPPKDFEPGVRLIINQLKRECQIARATGVRKCD